MNKASLLLPCLIMLFGAPDLRADALVVLPSGDLVCSVAVTAHQAPLSPLPDPGAPPKPHDPPTVLKSVEITRIGKLQRDAMTWSDGKTTEAWLLLNLDLLLAEKMFGPNSSIYELPRGSSIRNALCPTILDLNAASLSWISPQSFTGKTSLKGKETLHYQKSVSVPVMLGRPPQLAVYQAWIDAKTPAPLALDDGDALYDLTFSAPTAGTGPLVLPARFQKHLQEYENANTTIRHL